MILKRYSLSLIVVVSSFMSLGNLTAMGPNNQLGFFDPRLMIGKQLQNAQTVEAIITSIGRLDIRINGGVLRINGDNETITAASGDNKKALEDARGQLYEALQQVYSSDAKLGQAIAVGLAGNDKGIDGVSNVFEGIKLGAAMRLAGGCGDVMGKRIAGSAEKVLGGTWDFIVGNLIDAWKRVQEILFHKGLKSFTVDELKGWQKHIEICFLDIERLVKDGVKDALRGHDMSLRKAEDAGDEPQVQQQRTNVWRLLITGYIRQIEYFVKLIDKRIGYYLEEEDPDSNDQVLEDPILYYAKEIKQRLVESMAVLQECASVKELDAALDSSKHLIPAMNKNIQGLMTRLIAEVTPKSYSLTKDTGVSSKDTGASKGTGGMSSESEEGSRPFNSWNG